MLRACDGDVAAMRERRGDGFENPIFFARCALVESTGAIAECVALGICVIGDPLHAFREAVSILSQFG